MKTTEPSTAYDDQNRERRLGSELWGRTKPLLDELDWSRGEVARLQARLQTLEAAQPDPAHARAARSGRIEALILEALDNATLHAEVMEAPHRKRVSTVIDHLVEFGTRYRIKKPPCRETVCNVLVKYGYLPTVDTI
ncbi:hypothetical protein NC656_09295 [Pseudomonas asiatica]|uniref:hypothetical protein n=1 Tax=Pseudomonas asiatica TaxID=2219225 RepID=UPI00209BD0F8|nr:hypothetical protein [Pseudomonas asiatica]MCO8261742.1 hypothetical protein [Pseudomonas asiatica]